LDRWTVGVCGGGEVGCMAGFVRQLEPAWYDGPSNNSRLQGVHHGQHEAGKENIVVLSGVGDVDVETRNR
jgi:hypothetical protein